MSEIATHDPAPDSDFVIRVDLAEHGMPGRSEQLWARQVGPTRFVLRSIPFFAYGLGPGDEVETDASFCVVRVVQRSGARVLRVAATQEGAERVHAELHPILEALGLNHEWHRIGYVSVELDDVPPPPELAAYLEARAEEGSLDYEFA